MREPLPRPPVDELRALVARYGAALVAEQLHRSPRTIRTWMRADGIPFNPPQRTTWRGFGSLRRDRGTGSGTSGEVEE